MSSSRKVVVIGKLFSILAAVAVFGCAPQAPQTTAVDRMGALQANGLASSALTGNGNWKCPGSPNITLKNNISGNNGGWDYTGNEDFTVCASASKPGSFQISGTTSSNTICVYPMDSSGSGISLADNPQCFSIKNGAIEANFSATAQINYMVIVDSNYTQALDACLSSSSPCPAHSEGFVQ